MINPEPIVENHFEDCFSIVNGSIDFLNQFKVGKEFDNINVVVRVKPSSGKLAFANKLSDSATFPAAGQIQVVDPISGVSRSFTFDVVFEPEATQEEIFEHSCIKQLIDMALEGFASTIFAYGQTGSGKTYTLCGDCFDSIDYNEDEDNNNFKQKIVGIIQLSFAYLFEQIKIKKEKGLYYVITASYLEVYNEQVLDLLNPSHKSLNVRWSKDKGFYAENLFKVECEDIGDLEGVLEEGTKNRQVRSHLMNDKSSRSHSLLNITLASEIQDPEDPQGYIRKEGRLCLVDLAGSEKTKKTQSKGETLIEANNINRSLLVLGNCISALASVKKRSGHIPYRDSTLTKLLADSLSGSGMTLMIACISPVCEDASETINTLRYAARAKKIKTNPVIRMDPRELLILSLKREVRLLRMENNYLRQQLNLGNGFSNQNGERPTSNDSNLTPENNKMAELELKQDLLHKYMQQNEGLRAENAQLHQQRERLIHDHERVCRENDRLKVKLPNNEKVRLENCLDESWDLSDEDGKVEKDQRRGGEKVKNNRVKKENLKNEKDHKINGMNVNLKSKPLINSISEKFSKSNAEVKKCKISNSLNSNLNLEVKGMSAVSKTRTRK